MNRHLPLPPLELAHRVGALDTAEPLKLYEHIGRITRDALIAALPAEWAWSGKRVLDFGCGAGRTLRHFVAEAEDAEFRGCDIDVPSIDWARANLEPPFTFLTNDDVPPLALPDHSFDLIWSISVWTHLTDYATDWLLEMRRLLAPGGILVITVMAAGMSKAIAREEWDPDRVGMLTLHYGQSWNDGGPSVLHSPWWIRAHWGRAFDVLSITDRALGPQEGSQGVVVLHSNDKSISKAEIDRIDAAEPREVVALQHERRHAWNELARLRTDMAWLAGEKRRLDAVISSHEARLALDDRPPAAETDQLARELEGLRSELAEERRRHAHEIAVYEQSRSWRLTAPMRAVLDRVRSDKR